MMEYAVIHADNYADLVNGVNEHIRKGWRPQGGIAIGLKFIPMNRDCERYLVQAMVKEGKDGSSNAKTQGDHH